ncbi:MAG: DNA-3-methyladenine glycosylase [Bacteroidota bacterium]|nr:DNA-3-methyladenine glycosylase [Bacteroidota bacterium]MDP4234097.1 DNA-3-methyladenine glycosylase [Bacteroidota bacterium]MDP4243038.1 DNA-3-methyladenine glycosylase [Bacteroidota bacterium]MDP4287464.1 DNA-3-methyladenine glycosylase [Bacteroidota bacterium]
MSSSKPFSRKFYTQASPIVAERLLGSYLHRISDGVHLIGKIVETEAYGIGDEACHAFRGKTPRNEILFQEGGFSYVYFTYGMHHCFNVSTNVEGLAEAVLIRAVEPIEGMEKMRLLRGKATTPRELTNGPGKLCQAFGLTRSDNAVDLIESEQLFITSARPIAANLIGVSTRIGINVAKHYPWRFFIKGNEYVSRAKPSA